MRYVLRQGAADWRLLVGACVGVALVIGGIVWGLRGGQEPAADTETGRQVADAFLKLIQAGQADAAWESTSAEFKSAEGRESFGRYVRSHPVIQEPLSFVRHEVSDVNGLKRGVCHYEPAASPKSTPLKVRIVIAQEADDWKVEGLFIE